MKKVGTFEWAASFILFTAVFTFCDTSTMLNETTPTSGRYTLTYHANGATSGTAPAAEEYDAQAIVTVSGNSGSLAKTDLYFGGWNTKTDGSGVTYTQGQCFTMKRMNLTLYARWTGEPTYTVTYNANNATSGSVPVDSTHYETGMPVTVLGNSEGLAKTGFIFAGWNTAANGSGTDYAGGAVFTMGSANVTLYAKWATFTFPSTITVLKGTLLTNPDQPLRMTYVYIDSARDLYAIESTDGGATWGSANRATSSADLFDFAAAMDGGSDVVIETVRGPNMDGNGATAEWRTLVAGAWTGSTAVHTATSPALCRIPTVFRVGPSAILFGIGYDTGGGGVGDDTNALSLYWNGSSMSAANNVALDGQTDNPSYVHQVFGVSDGTIVFLYYDNHTDYESDGGDLYATYGDGFTNWSGAEDRVLDQNSNEQICHGRLFKAANGKYILIYTVKTVTDHTLFMKLASTVFDLGGEASLQISSGGTNVRNLDEANALYHTMYATQDPSGAIHAVWEDRETAGKIWRVRIDPASNDPTVYEDITDLGTLDGVSSLSGELFVSLHDSGTLTAKVVKISVP